MLDKILGNIMGGVDDLISEAHELKMKYGDSEKEKLKEMWTKVQAIDLDNLTDSELYAFVHTSREFRNKVSEYYQKRTSQN